MSDKVTIHDIEMVTYFLQDKGDVTRWVDWEKRKSVIAKEFPELIGAMDVLAVSERTLDTIVSRIYDARYLYAEETYHDKESTLPEHE